MRLPLLSSRIISARKNDHLRLFCNHFASSVPPTIKKEDDETNNVNIGSDSTIITTTIIEDTPSFSSTLLYKRNPSKAFFPRALLSLSTVHTGYWTWYVCDFTPHVQTAVQVATTSAITDASSITIDTTVGYVGLGLAIFMSIGSALYPTSLIQEIQLKEPIIVGKSDYDHDQDKHSSASATLQIRTYSLPFITPSSTVTQYNVGDVLIDSPNDTKEIITKGGGDISYFNGYLPLHVEGRYINLLLQLSDSDMKDGNGDKDKDNDKVDQKGQNEIYEKETLFHSLISPKLRHVLTSGVSDNDNNAGRKSVGGGHKGNPKILTKLQRSKERKLLRRR